MSSRRSRIVIKPNLKPALSKSSIQKPKTVDDQTKGQVNVQKESQKPVEEETKKEDKSVIVSSTVSSSEKNGYENSLRENKQNEKDTCEERKTEEKNVCKNTETEDRPRNTEIIVQNTKSPIVLDHEEDSPQTTVSTNPDKSQTEIKTTNPADEETSDPLEISVSQKKQPKKRKEKRALSTYALSIDKSPDRQKMKMSDLLTWNPKHNFFPVKKSKKENTEIVKPLSPVSIDDGSCDQESSNHSLSLPAPQIMIGADGNIIVDSQSLLIDNAPLDGKPKTVIEEDDSDRYVNSNTYRKYKKAKMWSDEETAQFFIGLSMCGTDFSLLENLFPNRSRRDLKNKFSREERRSRPLIDKALSNRQKYDPLPFESFFSKVESALQNKGKVKKERKPRIKAEPNKKPAAKKKAIKPKKEKISKKKDVWVSGSDDDDDDLELCDDNSDDENGNKQEVKPTLSQRKRKRTNTRVKAEANKQNTAENETVESQNEIPLTRNDSTSTQNISSQSNTNLVSAGNPSTSSQQSSDNQTLSSTSNAFTDTLKAIPGATQIQIELGGRDKPVQGVFIPSNIVPQIAPQLGIENVGENMQVLLVQEENESGSLVHVYVVPEGELSKSSSQPSNTATSSSETHSTSDGSIKVTIQDKS